MGNYLSFLVTNKFYYSLYGTSRRNVFTLNIHYEKVHPNDQQALTGIDQNSWRNVCDITILGIEVIQKCMY